MAVDAMTESSMQRGNYLAGILEQEKSNRKRAANLVGKTEEMAQAIDDVEKATQENERLSKTIQGIAMKTNVLH